MRIVNLFVTLDDILLARGAALAVRRVPPVAMLEAFPAVSLGIAVPYPLENCQMLLRFRLEPLVTFLNCTSRGRP